MKRRGFLVIAACLACISCEKRTRVAAGERFVSADDPAIHYSGRWDRSTPSAPQASWPGFGVSMMFEGSVLKVRMKDAGNFYNVEVDGKPRGVIGGLRDECSTYTLADGLADGKPHLVRMGRRNISFEAPTEIAGFMVDEHATLTAPPVRAAPAMEIIGDSFTAAEGDEATAATLPWKDKYPVTNFDLGFASLIARHYDAELTAVCRSGSGVVCDYTGNRAAPMVERYDRALMETEQPKWNFPAPSARLVLICLGLNDHSGLAGPDGTVSGENTSLFTEGYHRLVAAVRKHHPRARIIAVAAWHPWLRESIARVVAEERASGDVNVSYAQFDKLPGTYVADGHPTVETHARIAQDLIRQIGEL